MESVDRERRHEYGSFGVCEGEAAGFCVCILCACDGGGEAGCGEWDGGGFEGVYEGVEEGEAGVRCLYGGFYTMFISYVLGCM